jgi:glutamate N-acetyltransferase / amino-acid N-acetyltransferase
VPVIDPSKVSITIVPADGTSHVPVLVNGEPEKLDDDRAKEIMTQEDFELVVDLGGLGEAEAKYWTCDFSYVRVRLSFVLSCGY